LAYIRRLICVMNLTYGVPRSSERLAFLTGCLRPPCLWWGGRSSILHVAKVQSRSQCAYGLGASLVASGPAFAGQSPSSALRPGSYSAGPRGSSFTSDAGMGLGFSGCFWAAAFTEKLHKAGIVGYIGTVGDALDNAVMESTIGLFETEVIDLERTSWTPHGARSDSCCLLGQLVQPRTHSLLNWRRAPSRIRTGHHGLTNTAGNTVAA